MPTIVFVLARGQNFFFEELVAAIRAELSLLGVESRVVHGAYPDAEPDTAYVLVPPHEWYWLERRFGDPDTSLFPRTVMLCTEQPGTTHFDDDVNLSERASAVLDINRRAVREFERAGRDARHFQLGYTRRWDKRAEVAERDVDMLFLGCATERRLEHLSGYGSLTWRWRSRIVMSDNSRPNVVGSPGFIGGDDKLRLLARSKVLLNLHQTDTPYFEWLRAIEALSNGCAIVSERSTDYAPLEAGEHLLFGRPETLGSLVQHLLDDESRRVELADRAYAFVRDELPLRNAVELLVEAAAEAARAPLPALSAGARRRRVAVTREQPREVDLQPGDTTHDPAISNLKAGVKDLRLDMVDLRRDLERDRIIARDGAPPPTIVVDTRTPAWEQARPRISALTTLYNYGHHIEAALDSIATCGYRDVELIVVDDASTDDSLVRVREWMRRHPWIPTLLLNRPVNRGLPHGRNAALAFARGEFSFVLDADNEIYPGSLDRLVGALEWDREALFSWGMLERFDAQGPVGLMSWFPWDPPKLRVANYIDAMALLRTDALRELGGYTTDRRLHGWEDYDLWCRIAERGGHGALVPEVIARYRVSRHSMLSLTNLSSTTAYSVLVERYPRLMAGVRPPL